MQSRRVVLFIPLLMLMMLSAARAQAPSRAAQPEARVAELRTKLTRQLGQISAEFDGVMGIAVKDLNSGEMFEANADIVFPQASSIKIPILVALFHEVQADSLRLEERIAVKRAQMVGGSGVVQHFGDATSALSLHDLAVLMIVLSDNTATNVLIDRLGMDKVNDFLKRQGFTQTRLQRRMIDLDAQRASRENLSTPREMVTLLELLHQGKLLDPTHTMALMEILKYRKSTPLGRGLPETVELADKSGAIEGVRCDSGIVLLAGRPYAIAVMTTYVKDSQAAERAISDVSRLAFAYFERLARSNPEGARLPNFTSSRWSQEVGSGLTGPRRAMLRVLNNSATQTVVAEHGDRLLRFGFGVCRGGLTKLLRATISDVAYRWFGSGPDEMARPEPCREKQAVPASISA